MGCSHGRLSPPTPDWSNLPEDVFLLILRSLTLPDLLRSAAVCTSWSSAVRELLRRRRPSIQRHPPWLFVNEQYSSDRRPVGTKFYSLHEKRFYSIPFPYSTERVVGSSHGWLILSDRHPFRSPDSGALAFHISLLNPVTGARIYDLPPFQSSCSFEKAVCSSSPSDGGGYVVMAMVGGFWTILLSRPGDKEWTRYETYHGDVPAGREYKDIAFCNDEFYLSTSTGVVEAYNIINGERRDICEPDRRRSSSNHVVSSYLVACPLTGDLFQVKRFRVDPDDHSHGSSRMFMVCKITGFQKKMVTEPKKILGDYAFFVHPNNSMCLPCSEFPELRPRCIYFLKEYQGTTLGIYDLDGGSVRYVNPARKNLKWLQPTWITPSY